MVTQASPAVRSHFRFRRWMYAPIGVAALILAAITYLCASWPFSREEVAKSLSAGKDSTVQFGSFRTIYFPRPGCIAKNVTIRQAGRYDVPPLVSIQLLAVRTSYWSMLRRHISHIQADGLLIFVPKKSGQKASSSTEIVVDDLIAKGARLQFESRDRSKPLEFEIHEVELQNVGLLRKMRFQIKLTNPKPHGEVEARGTLGPWLKRKAGQTQVSGKYKFENADLSEFHGIAGTLFSTGTFDGTLEHMRARGSVDTRDFTVTSSAHKTELKNQFDAYVDVKNGDLSFESVDGEFRGTRVAGKGEVSPRHKNNQTAALDLCSKDGRIQDLLLLFITAPRTPLTGTANFCARVAIPAKPGAFLDKVELRGDFGVDAGKFTKPGIQQDLNKLSAESEGEKDTDHPPTVLTNLKGHVEIKDGKAVFSNLSFGIPGADANMHGTFQLVSHTVDLHGTLKMDSSVSHMAHGPKAIVLKVIAPFIAKKYRSQGSEVPVKITGTYEKPTFGLDLGDHKQTATSKRLQRLYQRPAKAKHAPS